MFWKISDSLAGLFFSGSGNQVTMQCGPVTAYWMRRFYAIVCCALFFPSAVIFSSFSLCLYSFLSSSSSFFVYWQREMKSDFSIKMYPVCLLGWDRESLAMILRSLDVFRIFVVIPPRTRHKATMKSEGWSWIQCKYCVIKFIHQWIWFLLLVS